MGWRTQKKGTGRLLAIASAAGASVVDFQNALHFGGLYTDMWIKFYGVNSSTDNTTLILRVDVGSGFVAGSSYRYRGEGVDGGSTELWSSITGNGVNIIDTASWRMGTGTGEKYNGIVRWSDPANTTSYKAFASKIWGAGQNGAAGVVQRGGGGLPDAAALVGVRFLASGGNITGEFKLYGRRAA